MIVRMQSFFIFPLSLLLSHTGLCPCCNLETLSYLRAFALRFPHVRSSPQLLPSLFLILPLLQSSANLFKKPSLASLLKLQRPHLVLTPVSYFIFLHNTYYYISYLFVFIFLGLLDFKLREGRDFCLFYSLAYPQTQKSENSNICQINEAVNE